MDYFLNWLYRFLIQFDFIKDNLKVHGIDNNKIYYYYYFVKINHLKDKVEYVHCYFNLRAFFSCIITFIIFFLLYKNDIKLISVEYIEVIKLIISLLFIKNIVIILLQLLKGIYYKFFYYRDDILFNGIGSVMLYLNFFFNIFLVYLITGICINDLLQYNILYVLDFLMINLIKIYNYYVFTYDKTTSIKGIQNFISYPYISIFLISILLKIPGDWKYKWCNFFYIYLFLVTTKLTEFEIDVEEALNS